MIAFAIIVCDDRAPGPAINAKCNATVAEVVPFLPFWSRYLYARSLEQIFVLVLICPPMISWVRV
jgi:hypothetical protein